MSRNFGYKNVKSKDGKFSPIYSKELNDLITTYCVLLGVNKTRDSERVLKEHYSKELERIKQIITIDKGDDDLSIE